MSDAEAFLKSPAPLTYGGTCWQEIQKITGCQYTKAQFDGTAGGVPRHGWGHSYPEAVAATLGQAG